MKHPPYHLRPNKAVDRFLLIESIRRFTEAGNYDHSKYTYYGFGGPFLEDFRLIRKYFPEFKLESIEKNQHTYKRQKFHKFCKDIKIHNSPVDKFLSKHFNPGERDIFWLDYTDLRPAYFSWFQQLLPQLGKGSIVKLTFPVIPPLQPSEFINLEENAAEKKRKVTIELFERKYSTHLPAKFDTYLDTESSFSALLLKMLTLATESVILSETLTPLLLCAHRYADGIPMMSITFGIVEKERLTPIRVALEKVGQSTSTNEEPKIFDIPILSPQERAKIDKILPQKCPTGKSLVKVLGYSVEKNEQTTTERLKNYAQYHRYFPLFARVDI